MVYLLATHSPTGPICFHGLPCSIHYCLLNSNVTLFLLRKLHSTALKCQSIAFGNCPNAGYFHSSYCEIFHKTLDTQILLRTKQGRSQSRILGGIGLLLLPSSCHGSSPPPDPPLKPNIALVVIIIFCLNGNMSWQSSMFCESSYTTYNRAMQAYHLKILKGISTLL